MDIEALLAERADEGPSGENLEFDAEFMQMEIAAKPGEEKQRGDEIIPATDPDFADVVIKALAIMERSHDLRAGVTLAGAVVHTKGLVGLSQALAYVRGCLEQWWATCHPQLDADDDDDPTMRINAVRGLADPATVLRGLKKVQLTNSRTFGRLTLRDVQVALGEAVAGPDDKIDKGGMEAAFADSSPEYLAEQLAAARSILADLKAMDAIFMRHTPGFGPDLDPLRKMILQVQRHVADHSAAAPDAVVAEEDAGMEEAGEAATAKAVRATGPRGAPGEIASQADASAALDALIDYFRRAEPSSPVPILLERAKRLVGADFLTILRDMAPMGVDNVRAIGGISNSD